MTTTEPAEGQQAKAPTCYRHPKRETYVRCVRCDRYMCPDCMRDAVVGHHCVECVRQANKTVRQPRTIFGGRITGTPLITGTLIAINVLAYLGELVRPGIIDRFDSLGIGLARSDGRHFAFNGTTYPGFDLIGIAHGEWYRLITSTFLHLRPTAGLFGIAHIVFNMWWLWRLGPDLEEQLGRVRFLTLYLLAGLGGSTLGFLIAPDTAAVGASGAIFGLVAAYYITSRRLHRSMADAGPILVYSLIWLVISASFTSWEGHLGGLIIGGTLALAYAYAPQRQRTFLHLTASAGLFVLLIALVALKSAQLTGTV